MPLDAAVQQISAPGGSDRWSPIGGARWIAVDLRDGTLRDDARACAARATLRTLPCPTIAVVGAGGARNVWYEAFDLLVAGEEALAEATAGITRAPLAAATLVQTLRATESLPIPDALAVESLAYATLQGGPEHAAWLAARGARRTADAPDAPAVVVSEASGTLVVTLARADRHNAYSARMRDELVAALDVALADPRLGVVVRGQGPSFCSGGDLDEFGTRPDPATAHLVRTTRSAGRALAALAPRVRAEVHGACIGAGVELAAFAGTVVAEAGTFFQLPELAMGLVPGAGGTVSLPRRIGRQRTAELALTGRRLDATTAHAWGLVDGLVPAAVRS